jgi:hypothetical protein
MKQGPGKLNIKRWLDKSLNFESADYIDLKNSVIAAIMKHGFKLRKNEEFNDSIHIEAIFGSKLKAFSIGLIPFGKHFSAGKRLLLKASLINDVTPTLRIQITPYMEIFGSEEVGGVTQSFGEKATDEYFGANRMYLILRDLYGHAGIPLPDELLKFDIKEFSRDTFLGILIYPLDSYNAPKTIHSPEEPGPMWCWGGFVLPEIWFLWNEIWGVSLLTAIPTAIYFHAKDWGVNIGIQYFLLSIIVGVRLLLGLKGNRIYYAKYGRWPK